jgi:hypothetical protein
MVQQLCGIGYHLRKRPYYLGLAVVLGSVSPDLDHAFSLLYKTPWSFLHQFGVTLLFIVVVVASIIGCFAALVLRKGTSAR